MSTASTTGNDIWNTLKRIFSTMVSCIWPCHFLCVHAKRQERLLVFEILKIPVWTKRIYPCSDLLKNTDFDIDIRFFKKHLQTRFYTGYRIRTVCVGDIKVLLYGAIIPLNKTAAYLYLSDPVKNLGIYQAYLDKHGETEKTTPRPIKRFQELLQSMTNNGYNPRNIIILNKDNLLADGQHRAAFLYHEFGPKYKVRVLTLFLVKKCYTEGIA